MKILYLIIKFFSYSLNSNVRKSFLFPMIGLLVGGYLIFMTLSIMNSMKGEIIDRINSFNYKYLYDVNNTKYNPLNSGFEKTCIISNNTNNKVVKIKVFNNIDLFYENKMKKYITEYSNMYDGIFIGSELAFDMNLNVGDTVIISSPVDINIITKRIPQKKVLISGIYKYDIFNYDNMYIISSSDVISDIVSSNIIFNYHDNLDPESANIKVSINNQNMLIEAINLEKRVYLTVSFFVVVISSILLFNLTILSLLEKRKQLNVLWMLSIGKNNIFKILLVKNLVVNSFIIILSFILSEITIIINYKYRLLDQIFGSLPFLITPFNFNYIDYSLIILFIIFITSLFGTLPLFFIKTKSIN